MPARRPRLSRHWRPAGSGRCGAAQRASRREIEAGDMAYPGARRSVVVPVRKRRPAHFVLLSVAQHRETRARIIVEIFPGEQLVAFGDEIPGPGRCQRATVSARSPVAHSSCFSLAGPQAAALAQRGGGDIAPGRRERAFQRQLIGRREAHSWSSLGAPSRPCTSCKDGGFARDHISCCSRSELDHGPSASGRVAKMRLRTRKSALPKWDFSSASGSATTGGAFSSVHGCYRLFHATGRGWPVLKNCYPRRRVHRQTYILVPGCARPAPCS